MRKHQYSKLGLIACIAALVAAFQVPAVADMAWASAALADMYTAATEASADLAAATGGGEKEMKKAQDNFNNISEALANAEKAYAKLEAADGDDAAAMDALRSARQQALGEDAAPAGDQGGDAPLNIHDVPWETDGLRSQRGKQQAIDDMSGSFGGGTFAERDTDATPI
jgi:hypothetical protein